MVKNSLPKWIPRFIRICCPQQYHEQILGDLEEFYNDKLSNKSKASSTLAILLQTLRYFHPFFLFRKKVHPSSGLGLIANYFKASKRTLLRNPLHTVINILGLTIGLTTCLTIYSILEYDYSFNRNHPDMDRVYRIYSTYQGLMSGFNRGVPQPLADYVRENLTGIDVVANFYTISYPTSIPQADGSRKIVGDSDNKIFTTAEYFDMLPYKWLAGDKSIMDEPGKVVLLESKAKLYFEDLSLEKIIGKTIYYRDSLVMEVGGIVEDLDYNSDFTFTDFLALSTTQNNWLKEDYTGAWGNISSNTQLFIKLARGNQLQDLKDQLMIASDFADEADNSPNRRNEFNAQPLSDLHFNPEIGIFDNSPRGSNKETLKMMTIVGLAILFIAVINFINLETAIAVKRAKEVGVRKVLGSSRTQLIFHFLNESYILTIIAVMLSLPLVQSALSFYSEFVPEGLEFTILSGKTLIQLAVGVIVVGLLAGLYPAFILSSMDPGQSLKDATGKGGSNRSARMRRVLTIFQFSFSQVLIILTIIVVSQTNFMFNKKLGFSTDNVLSFSVPRFADLSKKEVFHHKISQIPGVQKILNYSNPPIRTGWSRSQTKFIRENGEEVYSSAFIKDGDSTYVDFFEMELLAGRNMRHTKHAPEIIINETLAKELGFTDYSEILDKFLVQNRDSLTIVGVVKDFHFQSLHNKIEPMTITVTNSGRSYAVKIDKNADSQAVIASVEDAFRSVYPDKTFNSFYLEDVKERFYKSEEQTIKLATTAMVIAILISCLGLFGLASYSTEQKTKEIGIRKVLGSSVVKIVRLLMNNYLKYVTVAFFIATPIGYYISKSWLNDFAYSIDLSPWIFILTGLASWVIAFLTVAHKSIQAAMRNPAQSLRYE